MRLLNSALLSSRFELWPKASGEPLKKVAKLSGRVCAIEHTALRIDALLDKVPITRVANLTKLDRLGVPVFAAVTPLARDLSTHLGKGLDECTARVSAVMEAIERVSAEKVTGHKWRGSVNGLKAAGANVVDPSYFDLPPQTTYRADGQFDWVEGWDLIGAQSIWILADLVITPSEEGILDGIDTNGLAAGATYGEATRHALLELIERDAVSQHQFFELYGEEPEAGPLKRRINPDSLPEPAKRLFSQASHNDIEVHLEDLTGEFGIPVISCTLIDHAFPDILGPRSMQFGGIGADLTTETATIRAMTEACQSRLGIIQGARDSFNVLPEVRTYLPCISKSWSVHTTEMHQFSTIAELTNDNIADDIEVILQRLQLFGIEQAIVIDLMVEHLGIPVVRVRVPGLAAFVVDRLRLGWRCARFIL